MAGDAMLGRSTAIKADAAIIAATTPDLARGVVRDDAFSVNKPILLVLFIILCVVCFCDFHYV